MTKIRVTLILLVVLVASSCSLSKVNKEYRGAIVGNWILNDVTYAGNSGNFKSVLFNDVSDECFKGSQWFFRNSNSTGTYTINPGADCMEGARNIRWSVHESGASNQLQFKFIDEKKNDLSGGYGYRLDIVTLNQQEMTLQTNTTVEGEPITVVYHFSRSY
ncbi:lipocalin family protein [Sinomicrobium kalidii]|uniref:lipocalin family protein n=1 Tax=Sinomicrobium kalidii TaxID=2900738 RepID=UPI001E45850C|nr:lipocalin family protein [Sinomicrobium kalidii]UGU16089.1 lipocalin family protein [Sinomicrobium kalidii]